MLQPGGYRQNVDHACETRNRRSQGIAPSAIAGPASTSFECLGTVLMNLRTYSTHDRMGTQEDSLGRKQGLVAIMTLNMRSRTRVATTTYEVDLHRSQKQNEHVR